MPRKITVIIMILFLASGSAAWAKKVKCRCASQPFRPDPPCVTRCTTDFLVIATRDDLTSYFGLNSRTADAVVRARRQMFWPRRNLLKLLTEEERVAVASAFSQVGNDELYQFIENLQANDERHTFNR